MLSYILEDTTLIFCLRCDRDIVDFKKKETQSEFEEKYFSKTYERNIDDIKTIQLVWKKGTEEENFVMLQVACLMGTILLLNTSCSMRNRIIDYVQGLTILDRYA